MTEIIPLQAPADDLRREVREAFADYYTAVLVDAFLRKHFGFITPEHDYIPAEAP